MRCPKCGFDQPDERECSRCGVIVDRWKASGTSPRPVRSASPIPPPGRGSTALGRGLLALGGLGAAGVAWLFLRTPPPAPASPPAATATAASARVADAPGRGALTLPVDNTPSDPFPSPPVSVSVVAAPLEAPPVSACPLASGTVGSLPTRGPVSSSWQEGARGLAEAAGEQARVKAPLLVYFYTDWCPYCREFERTVLADSSFAGYRAVKARINPEAGREERAVADRFGVDGYPRLFLIASSSVSPASMSLGTREKMDGPYRFISAAELRQRFEDGRTGAIAELLRSGYDRRRSGDPAGAIRALNEAIDLEPEKAEAWLQRGMARQEAGDTAQAYEDFRTALSLQRGYYDVYARVTFELGRKGKWDEAAACWTACLEDGPRDGKAFYERSRAHAQRGDLRRAREDAEEACRLGEKGGCDVATAFKG